MKEGTQGPSRLGQVATGAGKSFGKVLFVLQKCARGLLLLPPLALGAGLISLAAWWYEHGAHVRQAAELHQLKKQADANVSQLQAQAEAAIREANQQHAREIRDLESRRRTLEQEAEGLRQRLVLLQREEHAQVEQVATLPTPELVNRVATRLGLRTEEMGTRGQGSGVGETPLVPGRQSPAPFALSENALRKVETALVELDACKEQSTVGGQQLNNCKDQMAADAAIMDQQKASLEKLNEALADKDEILARREAEQRAELKVIRGSWHSRLVRTLEHVGIGVAIGVAIRR